MESALAEREAALSIAIRLLILEDREQDAELIVRELRRNQIEPEWQRVDTEADFVAQLNSALPDVILSDYHMPQLDASRALGLLREVDRNIPFIVVSGAIGEDVAARLIREGAADYLLKDRLARLGPAVRNALQEKVLRAEARKAEVELRDSEVRFNSFMSNSPAMGFIKDEDGRILYINNTCEQVWHTTLAQCAGKVDHELWPPAVAAKLRAHDLDVLRANSGTRMVEHVPIRGGGELQLLSFRFPFTDSSGRRLLGAVSVDITEQIRAEQALSAALAAKEALLRELHHRVKNNLQVISSLLAMQAASLKDLRVAQALDESQKRVHCMAMIHDRLNENTSLDRIDFQEYVETLTRDILYSRSLDPELIQLHFELEPVALEASQAVPCGLILNELVTNSLKHAFPGSRPGHITVSLSRDESNFVTLRVSDDGVGLPVGFDWRQSPSLGLQIVDILAQQLDGELRQESRPNTAFVLTFQCTAACVPDLPQKAAGRPARPMNARLGNIA